MAYGKNVEKVYVKPHGIPDEVAVKVAKGHLSPEVVKEMLDEKRTTFLTELKKETANSTLLPLYTELSKKLAALSEKVNALEATITNYNKGLTPITLVTTTRKIKVKETVKHVTVTDETAQGKILWLAKEGFLNTWRSQGEIEKALTNRAWTMPRITLYKALKQLVKDGYLGMRKTDRLQYKLAPNITFE